jgi:hypothetical protein
VLDVPQVPEEFQLRAKLPPCFYSETWWVLVLEQMTAVKYLRRINCEICVEWFFLNFMPRCLEPYILFLRLSASDTSRTHPPTKMGICGIVPKPFQIQLLSK